MGSNDAARWLAGFERALTARDLDAAAGLFADECYWRDLVAFTWNIVTVEGRDAVRDLLLHTLDRVRPRGFAIAEEMGDAAPSESWIKFETAMGRGVGHLRLRDGRAWTLLTTLAELKGHEQHVPESSDPGRSTPPYVVIVGGGQGGIALGARLRRLRVPAIIVERNPRPGDSWRRRYKTLTLHDPVWYDHMPYLEFPPDWPVYSPKDKMADWLEMYTKVMGIDYWGSTVCREASYDDARAEWKVLVGRDGTEIELRPKQLVLATGVSGKPYVPRIEGMDVFAGEQHHSSEHAGPEAYRGQRAVVIGSGNSAHDICAALWEVGADVTMVQRSSTHVSRLETLAEMSLGSLYSEKAVAAGITTHKADLTFASTPYRIMHLAQIHIYEQIRQRDADFYARLEQAGFLLDFGDDGSGLLMKYLRRGSGYYIDVGASELIARGDIKLEPGVEVVRLTRDAVMLSNGRCLPADLVVWATGYGSMDEVVAELVSPEVAARVGRCWGLGSDTTKDPGPWAGELRNMWKPTGQEGLWFHGGNLHQSRHYSLYLALQLKARLEGIPTPVYDLG
jgi:putative flavoprotein involved in K+ transport